MPSRVNRTEGNRGFPGSSFKYTPLKHVRVLFTHFVQGLFAYAPVNTYHWTPDIENTELVVTDENPIHIETIGHRPAITFTRGPVQFYSLGMDDMLFYRFDIDQKTKSVLVPGTMSINCISRNDIESEHIAWIVAEHMWLLRERLMKQGFFEIGRQPQIGAPSPAGSIIANDQGEGWFVTVVSVPFQFYRTSSFTPLGNQIAENITSSLEVTTTRVASLGPPATAQVTNELPLNITESFPPSYAPAASDSQGATPDPAGVRSDFLPKLPHPLNPAKQVIVRIVRPNRRQQGQRVITGQPIPIDDPSVTESDVTQLQVPAEVKT